MSSLVPSASPFHQLTTSSSSTDTDANGHNLPSNKNPHQQQAHFVSAVEDDHRPFSSGSDWMDTLWAPPQLSLLNNNFVDYYGPPGGHHHHQQELVSPTPNFYESHQLFVPHDSFKEGKGGLDYGSGCGMSENHQQQQHLAPPMKLARSGSVVASTSANIGMPKCQQPKQRQMQKGHPRVESDKVVMSQNAHVHHQQPTMDGCRLVVLRQPEEQHRARYASEGSRGAIKDRAGGSFCTIQLIGHYQPTRLELFAGQQTGDNQFVDHHQYRLIPVSGKSSTTTPCRRVTTEEGTERMEVMIRPENGMIVVLDCIGIMKICSYGSNSGPKTGFRKARNRRQQRKVRGEKGDEETEGHARNSEETEREAERDAERCPNDVHIVGQARLPGGAMVQVHTEPIRCVQQLGSPDVLKMSLYEAAASGGQELFIIGRNFNPKGIRVLFREYNNDGTLGWSADAKLDQRLLHQCHIVCWVPAYQNPNRKTLVSVTVICGPKQSHPINFLYNACERDDDDWRPPDSCTNSTLPNATTGGSLATMTGPSSYRNFPRNHHPGYGSQNLRQKFGDGQQQCGRMAMMKMMDNHNNDDDEMERPLEEEEEEGEEDLLQ